MATTIQTAPMADTARLARYRQAERDLWHAYGLGPIERFVEVSLPSATVRSVSWRSALASRPCSSRGPAVRGRTGRR